MLTSILAVSRLAALALLAVLALQVAPAAAQRDDIDIDGFRRDLSPYGRWASHPRYGEVWVPDVDDDWRPYTRGHWVHTDEHGWYWESDEPFGWAVYHYGRWALDESRGWLWVPGTDWGPAWVAWRDSDQDVGWAPLPPEAEWRDGEVVYASNFYDSPRFSSAWVFVPVAALLAPRVWTHAAPVRRNAYFLDRTRFERSYRRDRHGVFNAGFDHRRYERLTGQPVQPRRIVSVERPERGSSRGGEVRVYRPQVLALPRPTERFPAHNDARRDGGPRGDGAILPRGGDRGPSGAGSRRDPGRTDGGNVSPRPVDLPRGERGRTPSPQDGRPVHRGDGRDGGYRNPPVPPRAHPNYNYPPPAPRYGPGSPAVPDSSGGSN